MHRLLKLSLLTYLPFLAAWGQDAVHTSTVTLSAGGETSTNNDFGESGGPVFNANYEYRIWNYLAVEAGADTMLPATQTSENVSILAGSGLVSSFSLSNAPVVSVPGRTRVTLVPFGLKGILPLAGGRWELFAGLGGAYAFHADNSYANAMLVRESLGGRFALDKGRHYWLGTSGQFSHNIAGNRQEWLSWTADFGLRFGR